MVFRRRYPIRLDDVDAADVLYFPKQIHFLVVAAEDLFREIGLPWHDMINVDRLAMPTVELNVRYLRPLRHGEECEIAVTVTALGRRHVNFRYEVFNAATGEKVCEAKQTVVFVDMTRWKSVSVPDKFREALAEYLAEPA